MHDLPPLLDAFSLLLQAQHQQFEGGYNLSNVFWVGAIIFGLFFVISLVWSLRPDKDKQETRELIQSEEALIELKALKADFEHKRLSAQSYSAQRSHIIERAVDDQIKASQPDTTTNDQVSEKDTEHDQQTTAS